MKPTWIDYSEQRTLFTKISSPNDSLIMYGIEYTRNVTWNKILNLVNNFK